MAMNEEARYYIRKLQLKKHPEGGYYREIYRAGEMFFIDPPKKEIKRNASTSIYFLLEGSQVSKFHRIKSDELWHFYDGSPVIIYSIDTRGNLKKTTLGKDLKNDQVFQTVIFKNAWFAAELVEKRSYALVGCTVSPGFDFNDFELANRNELINLYPEHENLIARLTNP